MINFDNFRKEVLDGVKDRPDFIRYGQAVFNYIDNNYGVARIVQNDKGIDCFYDDTVVDKFIEESHKTLIGE